MKVLVNATVNNTIKVSTGVSFNGVITVKNNVVIPQGGGIPYDGDYEITPRVDSQEFPTRNRLMKSDLKVNAIPYYETSNEQNGKTIFIG